ncbi:MAG: cache domain-containing protein, partial [Euryarchaeota archaeon]|nr:cache domain-containing protein [Euryarchaeota archaeon]
MIDNYGRDCNIEKSLFEFKSIKTKLTVIIVVMLIVAGTTLVGIAALMASSALEESMIETLDAIGDGTSQKLEIMAQSGKDTVSIFAADPKIALWLSSWNEGTLTEEERVDASAQLKATLSVTETFDRYNVVDNQGILVISSEVGYLGRDDSSRDVVAHQQRGTYVGEPYFSVDGTPRIPYARPVYDDNGKQLGLVYVALNLPSIEDLVFATHNLSEDARSFLVSSDGTILSGVKKDYSFFLAKKFDLSIFPPGATIVQALDLAGNKAYIVKIPIPGTDWFVITTERVEEVTGPIMTLIMTMVVCLLIVIVVGAFVTIFIANSFARPIQ